MYNKRANEDIAKGTQSQLNYRITLVVKTERKELFNFPKLTTKSQFSPHERTFEIYDH